MQKIIIFCSEVLQLITLIQKREGTLQVWCEIFLRIPVCRWRILSSNTMWSCLLYLFYAYIYYFIIYYIIIPGRKISRIVRMLEWIQGRNEFMLVLAWSLNLFGAKWLSLSISILLLYLGVSLWLLICEETEEGKILVLP